MKVNVAKGLCAFFVGCLFNGCTTGEKKDVVITEDKVITTDESYKNVISSNEYKNWVEAEDGLNFSISNMLGEGNPDLEVEVCGYKEDKNASMYCLNLANEKVKNGHARFFHVDRAEFNKILLASDGNRIQYRFRDTHLNTLAHWTCADHPYVTIDVKPQDKRFFVEVSAANTATNTYTCRLFGVEKYEIKTPTTHGDHVVTGPGHKFFEYPSWAKTARDQAGLTFSITNAIKEEKPDLKVEVCNHTKIVNVPTYCISMKDEDYVKYNQTRIFHIRQDHLQKLLEYSSDNQIQFRFKDTFSNSLVYWSCKQHPFVQLYGGADKVHKFTAKVTHINPLSYSCTIVGRKK